MTRRVLVVGAGITGIAAAWTLDRWGLDVTVLEASDRVGGKLRSGAVDGIEIDIGADAFLARHGAATDLARAAGLGDDLVEPATGQAWLWSRGALRPLPTGTVLGAPTDPVALVRSGVLSPGQVARAALEPLVPFRSRAGDRSVADVVAERFGAGVVDALVEPLLGGVYAGRPDRLSVDSTAPLIGTSAREDRSLLLGLRRRRTNGTGPVFQSLRGGLASLPECLAADLGERVHLGLGVRALAPAGAGWQVEDTTGAIHEADVVLLAVPAHVAAALVESVAPAAAADLDGVAYASVGVITLVYGAGAAGELPPGSGMLVPRTAGRLVKASTWVTRKWPHRAVDDRLVIRASVGRVDDHRWRDLDPDDLVARVDAEIRWATGISAPAEASLVTPWLDAMPQYEVGHRARVDRIRGALPRGLHVAGAAYDGIGISPCVASARQVATTIAA